jgi:hypothetical protein
MRISLAAGGLAVAGLLAAGCSSSPPAPVASPPAGAAAGTNTKLVYINCLNTHGAHLPPPGTHATVRRNSPQLVRAEQACRSLRPNPGGNGPVITAQDQADYLRAVQCVRSHGVPNFPDPVFANGGVHFPGPPPGLDIHSPQVQRAITICRRLIPAGLPYSR